MMLKPHCDVCDKVVTRKPVIVTSDNRTLTVELWINENHKVGHLCISCFKGLVAEMEEE